MPRPIRPLSARQPARAQISAEHLASLSHEFRTPLNGVLGMARLLEGTALSGEQRAYVAALRDSGEHLLTLVNDVLDFAKLGAGGIALRPAPTDLAALLQGVAELLSPRAAEKGVEVAWAAPPTPTVIRADEGRLRQILLNLAGNAVKFTQVGGVLILAEAREAGRIRFSVQDTGPGVPKADQDRIFEAFAQSDAGQSDLGGAGLGLAIARRIARAMGGEVGMESPDGGGAVFWFEATFAALSGQVVERPLAGRRIGVATPNVILGEAARRQIEASGGEAVVGARLSDVLAVTSAGDVVLLDASLAQRGAMPKPPADRPTLVLLAPDERGRIARYRRAGFAGYLIKPLRRASLVERILIAAGASQTTSPPREDERIATAAAPGLRVLLVEDNPINALLARTLLSREGCIVAHASSGEEALAAARAAPYDLILMDMRMPGLCGEETARRMRAAGVAAPIVALTANAFEDDRHSCLAAGMNDFLVKPLSPAALRATLTRWSAPSWTTPAAHAKVG